MAARWPVDPSTVLVEGDVDLRLARPADAEGLFRALDHDECWTHVRGRPDDAADLARTIAGSTGAGRWIWVARRGGSIVGMTSYLDVVPEDERLEIGFTCYTPSEWAGVLNPACKLMLLAWAFDHGFGRVQLKTDIRNERSQQAIERLGATREGVLRRYQRRSDGSMRDTVMYSILRDDWPVVRQGLRDRIP